MEALSELISEVNDLEVARRDRKKTFYYHDGKPSEPGALPDGEGVMRAREILRTLREAQERLPAPSRWRYA